MIAKTLNSSSQSSIIINHKIPAYIGVCLITLRMMQVIRLASSTEFATKIRKIAIFVLKLFTSSWRLCLSMSSIWKSFWDI